MDSTFVKRGVKLLIPYCLRQGVEVRVVEICDEMIRPDLDEFDVQSSRERSTQGQS